MLQIVPKVFQKQRMSTARRNFLRGYEHTFGNISAACEFAGISRQTFYRWMKSPTSVNIRFRERLARIQPDERKADFIDGKMMALVARGVPQVVIHADKTYGKNRGRTDELAQANRTLEQVAAILKQFLQERPEFPKAEAVEVFAKKSGVEPQELGNLIN